MVTIILFICLFKLIDIILKYVEKKNLSHGY